MEITFTSNKRIVFYLIIQYFCFKTFANQTSGFVTIDNNAYYLSNNTIFKLNIRRNTLDQELEITSNIYLKNKLDSILSKDLFYHTKSNIKEDRSHFHNINVINLTAQNHQLLITLKFQTPTSEPTKSRFAILTLDTNLICKKLLYFKQTLPNKSFAIFPFNSLAIDKKGNILLPLHYQNTIQIGKYKTNNKSKKILLDSVINHEINATKWKIIDNELGEVLYPVIYPIFNSDFQFYYLYPFPVIYSQSGKIIDVFKEKKNIDSLNNLKSEEVQFGHPQISVDNSKKLTTHVVLATEYQKDNIFMVCTTSKIDSIDVITVSTQSGLIKTKTIYSEYLKSNYYLSKGILFVLNNESTEVKKIKISLPE